MITDDAYVSTREAAELLGISLRTAQLWVESGVLLAWKTSGGHRRILRQSVEKILLEKARLSEASGQPSPADSPHLRIVLVEDDPDLLKLLELSLGAFEHPQQWPTLVRSAKDGFEGLILIGQFRPHIAIVDLNMSGMDGFRMIASMIGSEIAPELILVSTALSIEDITERGGLPSGIEILFKPYSLASLEAKIREHLPLKY